jgi:hypothetical protein
MKYIFPILFVCALLFSCSNDNGEKISNPTSDSLKQYMDTVPECDELLKLFHTVYLGNDHKIELNKDISSLSGLTNKLPNNFYSIKKGSFGVADSMAVEVNTENKIIAITAAYEYEPEFSNDTAYIHELHKYQKMLCKQGKEFKDGNGERSFTVTKWEAGNIIFELIEDNFKGKKKSYSVIFDKDLYYQKLKPLVDMNGKDISIEMYNRIGWNKVK